MARRYRKSQKAWQRYVLAIVSLVLVFGVAVLGVRIMEQRMNVKVENAGEQLTAHTAAQNTAQVFMNNRWYARRNVTTLLIMGVDDSGNLKESDSYNNSHQTDFLVLYLRDLDTGRAAAIHLNRDTMTDITMLGVTGQPVGSRYAQLALAYNYGNGDHNSSENVISAVEHLLYGMEVDNYITVTMDAVPIINDWAGGVTVEVLEDMTGSDEKLVKGQMVRLEGKQALSYVRTRMGLDDSTNINRMKRQRQYASAWAESARNKLGDAQAVTELLMQLDGYYRSDCTADQLAELAKVFGDNINVPMYEIQGQAVQGKEYMEFYVDEEKLQQLILELFYSPVNI